jgi:hypothetical protein
MNLPQQRPENVSDISAKIIIHPYIDWTGVLACNNAGVKEFISAYGNNNTTILFTIPYTILVRINNIDCIIGLKMHKVKPNIYLVNASLAEWKQMILTYAVACADFDSRFLADMIYVEFEKIGCKFIFNDVIKKDLSDGTFILRREG